MECTHARTPAYRTYLRHRAACPGRGATYAVRVPALGAPWHRRQGLLGVEKTGSYRSETENVDEDILRLGRSIVRSKVRVRVSSEE